MAGAEFRYRHEDGDPNPRPRQMRESRRGRAHASRQFANNIRFPNDLLEEINGNYLILHDLLQTDIDPKMNAHMLDNQTHLRVGLFQNRAFPEYVQVANSQEDNEAQQKYGDQQSNVLFEKIYASSVRPV